MSFHLVFHSAHVTDRLLPLAQGQTDLRFCPHRANNNKSLCGFLSILFLFVRMSKVLISLSFHKINKSGKNEKSELTQQERQKKLEDRFHE